MSLKAGAIQIAGGWIFYVAASLALQGAKFNPLLPDLRFPSIWR